MIRPRTPWQGRLAGCLLVLFVLFGVLTVHRTANLSRRMGDLNVYLRAGWAIRADVDPYAIACDNHWHYLYPPPYAILMAPLADPPARDAAATAARIVAGFTTPGGMGALHAGVGSVGSENPPAPDVGWCVPFAVSAAICYVLNLLAALLAIHLLASALEQGRPRDDERWWTLRLVPICVCVVPFGHTLMRGQVNTLLLLGICGLIAGLLTGRALRAGCFLAGAISLKVIPAYLLLVPFWLRDRRCLLGVALGLAGVLVLFPVLAIGPERAWRAYARQVESTLGPALRLGGDDSRHRELIHTTATDSQSFGVVLHNCLHPARETRPRDAEPWTRQVHWAVAGFLLLVTLGAAYRGGSPTGARLVIFAGSLTVLMILTSPVCHLHYLMLTMPLWMGLLARRWEREGRQGPSLHSGQMATVAFFALGTLLPTIPGLEPTRDFGLGLAVALILWGMGVRELATPLREPICLSPDRDLPLRWQPG